MVSSSDYDSDLHRVQFSITDDDAYLGGDNFNDETGNDANQTATVTDMDGMPIASGQIYDEEFFVLSNPETDSIWIESLEIAGQHVGYMVSAPLSPSLTYTQTTNMDAEDNAEGSDSPHGDTAAYSTFEDAPMCYAPGTLIDTPDGPKPVETITPGDLVMTQDHGAQPVRWTHSGDHPLEDAKPDAKPVLISAGALGPNLPAADLIVSPQHRVLVGGNRQLTQVFATEIFVPAKSLKGAPGIRDMNGKDRITWIHFACDRHEVIIANGCLSESLLLGPMVLKGMPAAERRELTEIFGTQPSPDVALNGAPAREILTVGMAERQLEKHFRRGVRPKSNEIKNWDHDLKVEKYEAQQFRNIGPFSATRKKAIRVA